MRLITRPALTQHHMHTCRSARLPEVCVIARDRLLCAPTSGRVLRLKLTVRPGVLGSGSDVEHQEQENTEDDDSRHQDPGCPTVP
jgi:hypothetical protein